VKEYVVIYERAKNNWAAYAPDVPGCIATGKTRADVERNFRDALEFHFEGLRAAGLPIPEPVTEAGHVAMPASNPG
jgi:predicted RNase H-like HicB family nuclease